VRSEELVGGTEHDVEPELAGAQPAVRGEVHAVRPCERADAVCGGRDPAGVRDRADGIRCEREGHDARALADQLLEPLDVERHVLGPNRRGADDELVIPRHEQPGRDVGVVIERRHDDLVARLKRAGDRVGEQKVERRHVGPEGDAAGLAAGELRGRRAGMFQQLLRCGGRGERAAEIGVRAAQVAADRVEHLLRRLRAAGSVEIGRTRRQSREPLPQHVDVKHRGTLARRRAGG
jgi:hypothetical protein